MTRLTWRMTASVMALGLLLLNACKDTLEPIPAYVRIEPFTVQAAGGADWQKITDGWLYINGEFLGAYTLPAEVPVLTEGETDIIVFPGIKENGILSTPAIYPFLLRYDVKKTLTAGKITTVQPITSYDPTATFAWDPARGTFDENSTIVLENRDSDDGMNLLLTSQDAFFGKSLLMEVDSVHPLMDVTTELAAMPTTGGQKVWLEMHYKTDMPFSIWLVGSKSGQEQIPKSVYLFNPGSEWRKIYLQITDFVAEVNPSPQHKVRFLLNLPKNGSGGYTQTKGKVLIDNIRIIHY
ncbi:MAG: hypothetical protein IT269_00845 [Saprospiraceae bacterium]|nr:hypothetical protein [Saprospiraceae bacterium]